MSGCKIWRPASCRCRKLRWTGAKRNGGRLEHALKRELANDNPDIGWQRDTVRKISEWNKKEIGVPESFLTRLATDDDWTTVIKLHSMLEAGLNRLLTMRLGYAGLSDFASKLDTGDRQRGKLALAKVFGLLSDDPRKFIRELSDLRNDLVHDVRKFEFSFPKWVEDMVPKRQKNLGDYSVSILSEEIEVEGQRKKTRDAILTDPKYVVSVACFGIMSILYHHEHGLIAQPDAHDQSTPTE